MILYKRIIHTIDGFEGNISKSEEFIIKEDDKILKNETPYTQDDVVEHDVVTLSWNTYSKVGTISDDEISVLKKFKILKR